MRRSSILLLNCRPTLLVVLFNSLYVALKCLVTPRWLSLWRWRLLWTADHLLGVARDLVLVRDEIVRVRCHTFDILRIDLTSLLFTHIKTVNILLATFHNFLPQGLHLIGVTRLWQHHLLVSKGLAGTASYVFTLVVIFKLQMHLGEMLTLSDDRADLFTREKMIIVGPRLQKLGRLLIIWYFLIITGCLVYPFDFN